VRTPAVSLAEASGRVAKSIASGYALDRALGHREVTLLPLTRNVLSATLTAMEARAKWTDDRLDDLSGRVGHLESRMDARFDKLEGRFDRLLSALIVTMGGLVAATLTLVAAAQF